MGSCSGDNFKLQSIIRDYINIYLSSHPRAGFSRTTIKACVLLLVLLYKCEIYTLQTPHPAGVEVHWDGLVSVHILLPPGVHTCGLCGDNDGNPTNDMVARYVLIIKSLIKLINHADA